MPAQVLHKRGPRKAATSGGERDVCWVWVLRPSRGVARLRGSGVEHRPVNQEVTVRGSIPRGGRAVPGQLGEGPTRRTASQSERNPRRYSPARRRKCSEGALPGQEARLPAAQAQKRKAGPHSLEMKLNGAPCGLGRNRSPSFPGTPGWVSGPAGNREGWHLWGGGAYSCRTCNEGLLMSFDLFLNIFFIGS